MKKLENLFQRKKFVVYIGDYRSDCCSNIGCGI